MNSSRSSATQSGRKSCAGCGGTSRKSKTGGYHTSDKLVADRDNPRKSASNVLLLQNLFQRFLQIRILKRIAARDQLGRFYALVGEQYLIAHLAKGEAGGEGGHGENRRA